MTELMIIDSCLGGRRPSEQTLRIQRHIIRDNDFSHFSRLLNELLSQALVQRFKKKKTILSARMAFNQRTNERTDGRTRRHLHVRSKTSSCTISWIEHYVREVLNRFSRKLTLTNPVFLFRCTKSHTKFAPAIFFVFFVKRVLKLFTRTILPLVRGGRGKCLTLLCSP